MEKESLQDLIEKWQMISRFQGLIKKWETIANNKFKDSDFEENEFGKKFIINGAFCYLNCARELKEVLADLLPREQEVPSEDQK